MNVLQKPGQKAINEIDFPKFEPDSSHLQSQESDSQNHSTRQKGVHYPDRVQIDSN